MEEQIVNAYTVQKLSAAKIAKEFGTNVDHVKRILKKHGVQMRS